MRDRFIQHYGREGIGREERVSIEREREIISRGEGEGERKS